MTLRWADNVLDTSTTTGTGNVTVSGSPPSGFITFSSIPSIANSDTFYYKIADQSGPNWEVGLATWNGSNVIARTTVFASSNGGSLVNFTSGSLNVWLDAPAYFFSNAITNQNLWTQVSYSTTIPLDGIKYMPRQTVAAPITFTAGTTVAGGQCYLRLIADGTNAPTFSGMTQSAMSSGYNNTNTVDNQITFWYDGITVWYAVQQ